MLCLVAETPSRRRYDALRPYSMPFVTHVALSSLLALERVAYFLPLFLMPWLPVFRGPFLPPADLASSSRAFLSVAKPLEGCRFLPWVCAASYLLRA